MFQSRISSAARGAGKNCVVDRTVDKLVERVSEPDSVSLALLDLTLRSVDLGLEIPKLRLAFPNCHILAYGPHVDVERLSQAEQAGADRVLTRGQMDRELAEIIQGP